jgi:hypothetical protein
MYLGDTIICINCLIESQKNRMLSENKRYAIIRGRIIDTFAEYKRKNKQNV